MKNLYNGFLIVFFIAFWGFYAYRVISEKIPRNILIFTGIFVVFFILKISGKSIVLGLLNIYKSIKNLNREDKGKIYFYVKSKTEKLDNFLEKEFKTKFLYRYNLISILSLKCLKIYEKNKDNFTSIFYIFDVLPWMISIGCYLIEIFYSGDLYFSLYIFPLSILIRRIFYSIFLTTIVYESKRMLENTYEFHFPIFYNKYATLREFFLVNPMPKYDFFYHQEQFKNKKDIIFFWDLFNELCYYNLIYRGVTNFHKPKCWHFKKFAFRVNGCLFTTTFFVILFTKIFSDKAFCDLLVVFILLFGSFCLLFFFLQFLESFELDENNNDYTNYFKSFENLKDFYADYLIQEKVDLLLSYDFLVTSDLKLITGYPTVKKMYALRNSPISSKMSLENFEKSIEIQKIISDWFLICFNQGKICMSSFSYLDKDNDEK